MTLSSTTPPDSDDPRPQGDGANSNPHGLEAGDVEALSPDELAALYTRAGAAPDEKRVKEITEVKAVLDLLMGALERDSGLSDQLQEQILAISCEIEAKIARSLSAEGDGPDLSQVKGLLGQLVLLIERSRAADQTPAEPVTKSAEPATEAAAPPVSLESDLMSEIAGRDGGSGARGEWSLKSLVDEAWNEPAEATAERPADVPSEAPAASQPTDTPDETEATDEPSAPDASSDTAPKSTDDPAMDALYQSLRVTEPPLLEQTAAGDIEVVAPDTPPQTLPKCLTEPWDDKSVAPAKSSANDPAAPAGKPKGSLFGSLGRIGRRFKKTPDTRQGS